jgi:shikimate kinase
MIPDRIFLVGFLGSRCDEIGRSLSARLERPLFSVEKVIEASARMPIADLYRKEGDNGFRQREKRALVALATGPPCVVATGPGTFIDRGNRRTIQQAGISVFVDATLEECLGEALDRGMLRPEGEQNERFTMLFEARRPEYDNADVIVEPAGRDPDAVADEILQRMEDRVWDEKFA